MINLNRRKFIRQTAIFAGGLVETSYLKVQPNLKNEEILGWGHAMDPLKSYSCI